MSGLLLLCTELTLLCTELSENYIYLNQSELSIFFIYRQLDSTWSFYHYLSDATLVTLATFLFPFLNYTLLTKVGNKA